MKKRAIFKVVAPLALACLSAPAIAASSPQDLDLNQKQIIIDGKIKAVENDEKKAGVTPEMLAQAKASPVARKEKKEEKKEERKEEKEVKQIDPEIIAQAKQTPLPATYTLPDGEVVYPQSSPVDVDSEEAKKEAIAQAKQNPLPAKLELSDGEVVEPQATPVDPVLAPANDAIVQEDEEPISLPALEKEIEKEDEVAAQEDQDLGEIEGLSIDPKEDQAEEVAEDEQEQGEELTEEQKELIASLKEDKEGLETTVCQQNSKISELEKQIEEIKKPSNDFMAMMNGMYQMLARLSAPVMSVSYQPTAIDMMSSMLAPTMLLQSMNMGMQMATMNNIYHNYRAPAPLGPQYNLTVGGDYYGRDYSNSRVQEAAQAQAQAVPSMSPYGFDFSNRTPGWNNVNPEAKGSTPAVNQPSPATQSAKPSDSLTGNGDFVT